MAISFLPTVEKCCFCIPLKWGAIIIAICTLLNCGWSFASSYLVVCLATGIYALILDITMYVMWAVGILTFIGSIIFLVGVIKGIPETATIFSYILLFSLVIYLVNLITSIVLSFTDIPCSTISGIISAAVSLLIWLYFIMVINSYEDEM